MRRARRLIYLEDQYLWSKRVADLFARAMADNPDLHLIAVVPRYPDVDGRFSLPPNLVGRQQAIDACRAADPERVHIFDVKVCAIDELGAKDESDNLIRRSWTHDSELSCAVLDETERFARDLRLRLIRAHLDRAADGSEDDGLVDLAAVVKTIADSARALDEWYVNGRNGSRPPGRLRPHAPEKLGLLTRLWAEPAYRAFYDPDGRSYRMRLTGEL